MSKIDNMFLWIIVLLIPFNGVPGPSFLGELSLEASTLFILVLIIINIRKISIITLKSYIFFIFLYFSIINILVNMGKINLNVLGGTSGWDKYITSNMVLIFYVMFGVVIYIYNIRINIIDNIRGPVLAMSGGLCVLFLLEFLSWNVEYLRQIFVVFRSYVSINSWFATGRIYGVSFEPSFNAAVIIGLWPLLGYYAVRVGRGVPRSSLVALLAVFIATAFFSDSRTAILVVAMQVTLFICLKYSEMAPRLLVGSWWPIVISVIFPVFFWYYIAHDVSNFVIADSRISNLTRMNAINALISIWKENIFFGVGLGQFGFLYRSYASSLSMASWEVTSYFYGDRWNMISPSFSLHWRILAEGGILGYLCFFLPFCLIFRRIYREISLTDATDRRNLLIAIQVGLAGSLLFGISYDSFRNPMLWIYAGLGASCVASRTKRQTSYNQMP